jgi:hypothetical protein
LAHRRDLFYLPIAFGGSACWDMTALRQSGKTLYLYPCHAEDHQLFQFVPHADGTFAVFTTTGLQCLEVRGARVEQQPCNSSAAQKWVVRSLQ